MSDLPPAPSRVSGSPSSVVIVGGGIAGVTAAGELRGHGFEGSLTIVEQDEALYDRPPLSKAFLRGEVDEAGIALQPAEWFRQHRVTVHPCHRVLRAAPVEGVVEVESDGVTTRLTADAVILATGARARELAVPGSDSARVHMLRTLDHARALRSALTEHSRVLVVGGGLIGAEVASTALAAGAGVTLVDPMLPLRAELGTRLAGWLHGRHAAAGVDAREASVTAFEADGDALAALLTTGEEVTADAVVVGIGAVPEVAAAEASGVRVADGIVVDSAGRTSVPGVWAVGDCARTLDDTGVLGRRSEHWDAAMQSASVAAASVMGATPPAHRAPWFWSDRHGLHLQVAGTLPAEGAEMVVRGEFGTPPFAMFAVAGGRVVWAASVNDPRAVRAARRLIDRRVPVTATDLTDRNLSALARAAVGHP